MADIDMIERHLDRCLRAASEFRTAFDNFATAVRLEKMPDTIARRWRAVLDAAATVTLVNDDMVKAIGGAS